MKTAQEVLEWAQSTARDQDIHDWSLQRHKDRHADSLASDTVTAERIAYALRVLTLVEREVMHNNPNPDKFSWAWEITEAAKEGTNK